MSSGLPNIGEYLEDHGGYVGAYISLNQDGVATHALIVSPREAHSTDLVRFSSGSGHNVINQPSEIDGPGNFEEIVADMGNASYPAAERVQALNDENYNAHNDWYLPAMAENSAICWNLKPTATENRRTGSRWDGNPWAVPQIDKDDLTASNPPQTEIDVFKVGGGQDFVVSGGTNDARSYWSTTTTTGSNKAVHSFDDFYINSRGPSFQLRVRAIRRVSVKDIVPAPDEQEIFQASFEDASGRDPLPTALLERTPAKQLCNHLVNVYRYPPYIVTKRVPIELDDYDLVRPGNMIWHKDDDDPLFAMGRWAQVQGRRFGDNPVEVELTLRISDHPESFEAPT